MGRLAARPSRDAARPSRGDAPAGDLVDRLRLDTVGQGVFARPGHPTESHLFGGLLVAQALQAAWRTLPDEKAPHSVHGHFVAAGDGRRTIEYRVEPTRDGRSFSTRRVAVVQDETPLFVATVSFHSSEPGHAFQPPAPARIPDPEALPRGRYDSPWFDSRDVPQHGTRGSRHRQTETGLHRRLAWFRARRVMPDDPAVHCQAIVYMTDHGATRAVRQPHADHPRIEERMSVSLDHTVWIHAAARADQWLLTEFRPLVTQAGRGLAFGSVWTRDGTLVASVMQEALLRLP